MTLFLCPFPTMGARTGLGAADSTSRGEQAAGWGAVEAQDGLSTGSHHMGLGSA